MGNLSYKKEVSKNAEELVTIVTERLKEVGFGVLTRIDFDQKMKEKLDKTIPKTIVLGACNPKLAYAAYEQTTDVTLLVPCNVVIRDVGHGKCAVEAIRPSMMMQSLKGLNLGDMAQKAEADLEKVIQSL